MFFLSLFLLGLGYAYIFCNRFFLGSDVSMVFSGVWRKGKLFDAPGFRASRARFLRPGVNSWSGIDSDSDSDLDTAMTTMMLNKSRRIR